MQYIIAVLSMLAGFVGGYFFNPPVVCHEQKECAKEVLEKVYEKALKNCIDEKEWEDYDCFRYMNTGRAPSTPTPRPIATPAPLFKYKFNYDKYKSKDDDESE